MNKPTQAPNPIIAKLAHIMMLIEHSIYHQNDLLTENREKFIAQTAFNLTHLEDIFFSADQIKKLVIIMVQYHETGVNQWHIDLDNSTAEHIAVTVAPGRNLQVPAKLFISTVPQNGHGSAQASVH
ncbi:MAG: hypothetical protein WAW41_10225 [Methylobacter sp.]